MFLHYILDFSICAIVEGTKKKFLLKDLQML